MEIIIATRKITGGHFRCWVQPSDGGAGLRPPAEAGAAREEQAGPGLGPGLGRPRPGLQRRHQARLRHQGSRCLRGPGPLCGQRPGDGEDQEVSSVREVCDTLQITCLLPCLGIFVSIQVYATLATFELFCFRIVVELSVRDIDNSESLDAGSGIQAAELPTLISEAGRLGLEITGLALSLDVLGSLDQDENLAAAKRGLEAAEAAVKMAMEANLDLKTLHLGQICVSSANVSSSFINEINNIISKDVFSNLKICADASNFLISSCVTLAARITDVSELDTEERMTYAVNESVFGAFSINLSTPECCISSPLILGGGGRRKGLTNKLLDTGIFGISGQKEDVILPMGEVMLPRLEVGDWLLFPHMGASNLSDYDNFTRKIVGNKSFVCVRKPATKNTSEQSRIEGFTQAFSAAASVCIDLDQQNQNYNPNIMGLRGEIDLRKTFIYED